MYDSLPTPPSPEHRHRFQRLIRACGHVAEVAFDWVGDRAAPKPLSDQLKDGDVSPQDITDKPLDGDD